jgi:hypothetical protein
MNSSGAQILRDRFQREVDNARSMVEFIQTYRWVTRGDGDNRSDDEIIESQVEWHLRLIANYSNFIAALDASEMPQQRD